MIKNYIKIAFRNLWKEKTLTSLNIIGLTVAFAVSLLLSTYVVFQFSYDTFHDKKDHIYQAYMTWQTPEGTEVGTSQPTPLAETLVEEVPGIKNITRHLEEEALTIYKDKELNLDALYVDSGFFKMFSFPIINGTKENALADVNSVVITKSTALKLFNKENPVGKTIGLFIKGTQEPFTVSAVTSDPPKASTITYEIAIPFKRNPNYEETKSLWGAQYHEVFIELDKDVSPVTFEQNSRDFTNLHYKGSIDNLKRDGAPTNEFGNYLQMGLLPFKDVHFASYSKGYVEVSNAKVTIVLGIAFLILFIACVNFINMSIARSSQRLKEIGMRKTLGAEKRQIFFQFWLESLLVYVVSAGLGILVSILLQRHFQRLFGTTATFQDLFSPTAILTIVAVFVIVSMVVGGYPALLLNRLTTVQSLKGKLSSSGNHGLRNALIVVQFSIAILLICGTFVLNGQIEYMRTKDLGYDKEHVFSFPLTGKKDSYDAVALLREQLASNPSVLSVTGSSNNLGRGKDGSRYTSVWGFDYKGASVRTHTLMVDYNYVKTLDLKLLQGRSFDSQRKNDSKAVLINERMAEELQEENPLTAQLPINDSLHYTVIGVVKDYHFSSLSQEIEPITFFLDRQDPLKYAFVKVAPGTMVKTVRDIEEAYAAIEPNAQFLGSFLDENVDRTFRREKNLAALITTGSIIAIILCCMGLFAMSLLTVARRQKEIGIRKVIGATVLSLTLLLTKEFLKLVAFSFVIAAPLAWWGATQWLQSYTYRLDLSVWLFAAAGLVALLIATLTIGTKTIKAALANPVKSLKTE